MKSDRMLKNAKSTVLINTTCIFEFICEIFDLFEYIDKYSTCLISFQFKISLKICLKYFLGRNSIKETQKIRVFESSLEYESQKLELDSKLDFFRVPMYGRMILNGKKGRSYFDLQFTLCIYRKTPYLVPRINHGNNFFSWLFIRGTTCISKSFLKSFWSQKFTFKTRINTQKIFFFDFFSIFFT